MNEVWKDIKGYEGLYQISNFGRVKSLKRWHENTHDYVKREIFMNPTDNGNGYLIVGLVKDKKRKNHYIHKLVAGAFISNINNYEYVNHIDYDRKNNKVENLEWCTQKQNIEHSAERMKHPKRTASRSSTGEKYIYKRKGRYRVVIGRKEYGTCATIKEAIKKRDGLVEVVTI